jgi:hypothetical protein
MRLNFKLYLLIAHCIFEYYETALNGNKKITIKTWSENEKLAYP